MRERERERESVFFVYGVCVAQALHFVKHMKNVNVTIYANIMLINL